LPNFDYGLKEYFKQHGPEESVFIAGGMMTFFYILYSFTGLPLKWQYLAVYGVMLDMLFRKYMIFESLKGYYAALSPTATCFWQAFSMVLPLLFLKNV
jgi:hypothetical protein